MITPVIFKILTFLILSVLYSIILCSKSMKFQCNYIMDVDGYFILTAKNNSRICD